MGEAAEILLNFWGVKNFVNGGCAPFGLENNPVFYNRIILEVETDAEVMKVSAELEFVFAAFKTVGIAES